MDLLPENNAGGRASSHSSSSSSSAPSEDDFTTQDASHVLPPSIRARRDAAKATTTSTTTAIVTATPTVEAVGIEEPPAPEKTAATAAQGQQQLAFISVGGGDGANSGGGDGGWWGPAPPAESAPVTVGPLGVALGGERSVDSFSSEPNPATQPYLFHGGQAGQKEWGGGGGGPFNRPTVSVGTPYRENTTSHSNNDDSISKGSSGIHVRSTTHTETEEVSDGSRPREAGAPPVSEPTSIVHGRGEPAAAAATGHGDNNSNSADDVVAPPHWREEYGTNSDNDIDHDQQHQQQQQGVAAAVTFISDPDASGPPVAAIAATVVGRSDGYGNDDGDSNQDADGDGGDGAQGAVTRDSLSGGSQGHHCSLTDAQPHHQHQPGIDMFGNHPPPQQQQWEEDTAVSFAPHTFVATTSLGYGSGDSSGGGGMADGHGEEEEGHVAIEVGGHATPPAEVEEAAVTVPSNSSHGHSSGGGDSTAEYRPHSDNAAPAANYNDDSDDDGDDGRRAHDGPTLITTATTTAAVTGGADNTFALLTVGDLKQKMTADEMQDARLRTYDAESAGAISTLDFLRETGDTVLPDAVQSMFASTANFFRRGSTAVAQSVPAPLRAAASRAGYALELFADFTGDLLVNAPEYAASIIPGSLLSKDTKQLLFVDFLAVLRVTLDVNILAVPYLFRLAGLVGGLLLLLGAQLLCYYNTGAFFAAKNQLREASMVIMYGDVPRLTWGRWFPMISTLYGLAFLTAFSSYAAANLGVLLADMGLYQGRANTALSFILPSVFALPFAFMKRASAQKPLAAAAALLVFISVILFMAAFPYKRQSAAEYANQAKALGLWAPSAPEFFTALGIATYVACPLRTAVPVERDMDSSRFMRLLAVATIVTTAWQITFGVCAFVTLRSDTCSVLAVSLAPPSTSSPSSSSSPSVAVAATALLFFAFIGILPLAQFRISELCDRRVLGHRTLPSYGQFGPNFMRVVLLAATALVAWLLPYYGLLIGLGGAFGCGLIGCVVPAALDYVRKERLGLREGRRLRWWEYLITFSNAVFGMGAVVLVGVVFTIYQLWLAVQAGGGATAGAC